jgi:hypothetical protein
MVMTMKEVIQHEYFPKNDTVTIHIDKHYYEDGEYIGSKRHSQAFVPGTIDDMKTRLNDPNHPVAAYIETVWTPQVIADYQQKYAEKDAGDEEAITV